MLSVWSYFYGFGTVVPGEGIAPDPGAVVAPPGEVVRVPGLVVVAGLLNGNTVAGLCNLGRLLFVPGLIVPGAAMLLGGTVPGDVTVPGIIAAGLTAVPGVTPVDGDMVARAGSVVTGLTVPVLGSMIDLPVLPEVSEAGRRPLV